MHIWNCSIIWKGQGSTTILIPVLPNIPSILYSKHISPLLFLTFQKGRETKIHLYLRVAAYDVALPCIAWGSHSIHVDPIVDRVGVGEVAVSLVLAVLTQELSVLLGARDGGGDGEEAGYEDLRGRGNSLRGWIEKD